MKRSKFSLSHYRLFSCDMGKLIPCACYEVLPGDTVQMATSLLVRAAPLVTPVMHPVTVRLHHWFVPYRLLWTNWESFITGGPDGLFVTQLPTRTTATVNAGTSFDYLGLPITSASSSFNALPNRAYQMIWNEWYRDQDLTPEQPVQLGDLDTSTPGTVRDIMWEKDYLTSSRPWEQKGPTITIPLGTTAPVLGIGVQDADPSTTTPNIRRSGGVGEGTFSNAWEQTVTPSSSGFNYYLDATGSGANAYPNIRADLSTASAITLNALREAAALQRYEENRARYGSRYVEYLRVLGVRSSDARLQRPEYLGGGKQTIQFSEVLQTGEGTNPVGTMRGHGISALRSNRFRRFFEEHGVVISLFSVRPKTIYTNGMPRHFTRKSKEDFFQKELQHIGQQAVENREVYVAHGTPEGVFGYQDRYDEYRRQESGVSGEFATTVLNSWHMARDFASAPALNASFVTCTPTTRNFASATNDTLYVMARHSIQARRIVAKTGTSRLF